jgi:hypothetical protein
MSEPRSNAGPLAAVASVIADEAATHQALPPDRKNGNRAYMGAFLLGIRIYLALTLNPADYDDDVKIGFAAAALCVAARNHNRADAQSRGFSGAN